MSHQGQTRFAQTVSLMAHNADFWRLRISKYPANAHERNYLFALVTGRGKRCMSGDFAGGKMPCEGVVSG